MEVSGNLCRHTAGTSVAVTLRRAANFPGRGPISWDLSRFLIIRQGLQVLGYFGAARSLRTCCKTAVRLEGERRVPEIAVKVEKFPLPRDLRKPSGCLACRLGGPPKDREWHSPSIEFMEVDWNGEWGRRVRGLAAGQTGAVRERIWQAVLALGCRGGRVFNPDLRAGLYSVPGQPKSNNCCPRFGRIFSGF